LQDESGAAEASGGGVLRRRESWEVPVQGAKIIEKVFKEAISQLSWSVNDISGNAADFQELLAGSWDFF
jgi:hypothetical protein